MTFYRVDISVESRISSYSDGAVVPSCYRQGSRYLLVTRLASPIRER